ncbi:hypothetical protein EL22_26515 [Halostagnicola sp. A56]|nr:hypothetical protein EL22_26515 [Halostagnicola sp. A56]
MTRFDRFRVVISGRTVRVNRLFCCENVPDQVTVVAWRVFTASIAAESSALEGRSPSITRPSSFVQANDEGRVETGTYSPVSTDKRSLLVAAVVESRIGVIRRKKRQRNCLGRESERRR